MATYIPSPNSDRKTVTIASVQFAQTLASGTFYIFQSSSNCYIAQGANPTAAAAAGSTYVGANVPTIIDGALGAKLAVIRATADGEATLTSAKVQ